MDARCRCALDWAYTFVGYDESQLLLALTPWVLGFCAVEDIDDLGAFFIFAAVCSAGDRSAWPVPSPCTARGVFRWLRDLGCLTCSEPVEGAIAFPPPAAGLSHSLVGLVSRASYLGSYGAILLEPRGRDLTAPRVVSIVSVPVPGSVFVLPPWMTQRFRSAAAAARELDLGRNIFGDLVDVGG